MKIIRYKHNLDFTYALGATLVFELLKTRPEAVRRIFLKPSLKKDSPEIKDLLNLISEHKIEVFESDKPFNILSPKDNCFVIAEFSKTTSRLDPKESNLVLVNPSDAGNIGTIVRTAVGLGYQNIAVISPAVDVYDPKAIRATMGAIFHANVQYFANINEFLKLFPTHSRYSFMLKGAHNFDKTEIKAPFSLIFGNEASGLPDEYAELATSVKIPQSSEIDSFSLPIAASIAMYECKDIK
jgi:TrmH family RNA methyltransferase